MNRRLSGNIVITIVISVVLLIMVVGVAAGMTLGEIRRNTGETPLVYAGGGSQFQVVKTMEVYITMYSPVMENNTCDDAIVGGVPTGGTASTADSQGMFRVKDGKIRWVFNDLIRYEDYVFAQEYTRGQPDPIIPWEQRNELAVVVPGFKNNLPIHIRDHYGKHHEISPNFLDLFSRCDEQAQIASELESLSDGKEYEDGSRKITVQIVDTTKPINGQIVDPVNQILSGVTDFRSIAPGSDGHVGKWKSIDEVFSSLGGKSQANIEKQLDTADFMGVSIKVHHSIVAPLGKVEQDIKASGTNYKFNAADTGGYVWRTNTSSPNSISPHATGLAIDVNSNTNPYKTRADAKCFPARNSACCPKDIPKAVSDAFEKNGFFWGTKFNNVCDAMHFQYGGNWD